MKPLKIGLIAGAVALSSVAAMAQGVDLRPEIRWSGKVWVIDGADRRGDELRVEINRRGEIVDVDRSF